MTVKAINDTAGPNRLVSTLLLFKTYLRIHSIDLLASTIIQKATAIQKIIVDVRKIRTENYLADALNTKNGRLMDFVHDLPLNSDVLVGQEDNIRQSSKWTDSFKLLGIKGEICKIYLPSSPTEFRNTVVKPYLVNNDNTENNSPPTAKTLSIAQSIVPNISLLSTTNNLLIATTRPSHIQ